MIQKKEPKTGCLWLFATAVGMLKDEIDIGWL
jgi:hypothetical protein